MQAIWTSLKYSSRSCTSASTALLCVLAICFFGRVAKAQVPASADVLMSQSTELGVFPAGGGQSGSEPAGDTMAVNSLGDVIASNTFGNQILLFPPQGGTPTVLGTVTNPNGVAVDKQNNLFIGFSYSATVLKIPYVSGAYVAIAAPTSSTPSCTGADTAECVMSNVTSNGTGIVSMVFDSQGNLFYSTNNSSQFQSGTSPNSIFECTAACLYSAASSPAATMLFAEPVSSTPTTTGQLSIGGLAIDASDNLFFTDSMINTTPSDDQTSFSSNLNELPFTSGTGYPTTATVIYTFTPTSVGQNDSEIDGVGVDKNDTVYALIQNSGGILAFPVSSGTYSKSNMYTVSTVSGKLLAMDTQSNFYADTFISSGDAIVRVSVNNLTAATAATGASSTTSVTTLLNDGPCGSNSTVSFSSGMTSSAFSAATSGTCSSTLSSGGSFTTTITFTPTTTGINTATLTATDSAGNSANATVTGNATGTVATPTFSPAAGTYTAVQSVAINDATMGATIYYTTDGSTPTSASSIYSAPISVTSSETLNAIAEDTGDTNSEVASATYTLNIPPTATPAFSIAGGTFITPQSITLSDTITGASIYYTTDGSTPTITSTLYTAPITVATSETINAIATAPGALNSMVATASFTINLPASAFQNVVLTQLTELGMVPTAGGSQSGGEPAGDTMAVNSLGDVITSDTFGNQILLFPPQGGTPTVLGSVTNPNGVAVDSQNNLYLGFSFNSSVVKIPYENGTYTIATATTDPPYPSGTPNCTGNDTVECVMNNVTLASGAGVVSLVFDSMGDLFFGTTNQNQGGNNSNSIYECTAACLYSTTGSPAATLLFTEPTSSAPNTMGQLSIGGMAIDGSGNLFFTDSAIGSMNNQESFSSNLNELPFTSGSGYAHTPTVIYSYTPSVAASFGAELDGVAVAANDTVYALIQGNQPTQTVPPGLLAFPNMSGTYSSSTVYLVSPQNGKLMTSDALGNLYVADDGGNIDQIAVDNLTLPTVQLGATPPTATNITTILNDGGCSATPPTVSFTASASAFSAATTGTCTAIPTTTSTAASFATTLTFTPTTVGTASATLTATDSAGNSGTAAVSETASAPTAVATPTFSPVAGTYSSAQTVAISDTATGAAIYYTTDGSTPTTSSTLYSTPLTVSTTETINAIAVATGLSNSTVASALFTINLPAATPTFSVPAGTYTTSQTVTLSDSTTGAMIYYTTDGSTPTAKSTPYSGAISVSATETINAIAVASGFSNSTVATAAYTINLPSAATPTFSVAAGTYVTVQTVSLSDATTGAAIYYTTDGSTPTAKSTLYSGAITVAVSATINAIAVAANNNNSAVATAAYVINLPPPGFTITASNSTVTVPASGTGTVTLTITANAAFNGSMSFACSGFLPIGASCAFTPTSVTLVAGATSTSMLTVTTPKTMAALHRGPSPLVPGTMLATALCLLGLRKRRRLQMLLMFTVSAIGLTTFTGCTTTSSSSSTSSQFVVTATGSSLPVNAPSTASPTGVTEALPLVLTVQ
jgi:hypothetical protein